MDLLKKILRQALATQASRVKLTVGGAPELADASGQPFVAEGFASVTRDDLSQLYDFLFPSDRAAIAARQPTRGALNVPNVGKIQLIAQPAEPASLRLYLPPQGNAAFESDWGRLSSKTVTPDQASPLPISAPVASPRAPASPAPAVPPALFGEPAAAEAIAPLPSVRQATPASPAGDSARPSAAGGGGFIPFGLAAQAAPSPQAGAAAEALPKVARMAPRPSAPATPPTELVAPAFVPSFEPPAPPPAFPDPVPALAPHNGQALAFQEPMAILSPHLAAASAASDEPTTIDFGPDAGGMASKSYGDNAIDAILADMVKRRASDLHITCGEPYCYRVDGDITRIGQGPVDAAQMEQYLGPIMPERNRREFMKQNDTDFAYEIDGVGRFRVNVFRDKNGAGTVLRHIPSKILTAEQLHLPPAITKFCDLNKGLVLVTGPTGSGKSTTLAAMIDMINKNRADHILTIEDPIEFVHPQHKCLVNQREVHKHTTSFSRALKAALREDPDIVLIGEMRDLETIAIAIETAETGHLVFGTLHTTTAVSTVDRIIDQFPSDRQEQIRMMLAGSLRGVVAQILLKKKGGGRVAAHEILVTNDAVSAMIREGKNHMIGNHMQSQKADGNQLLNEALARYVKEGVVDAEEAYRKAVDKASLAEMFRRMNVSVPGMAPAHGGQRPPGGPRTA
jgi:twitching motility protein PilT